MPTEVRQLMVVGVSSNALNTNILDDLTLVWMTSDCVALWTFDEESTKTHSEGKYKDVFLHDSSRRGNVAYLGRESRMPKRYVNDAPPSRIPCVSKSPSPHDDDDEKGMPREKIDLNVDYEESGKNATLAESLPFIRAI